VFSFNFIAIVVKKEEDFKDKEKGKTLETPFVENTVLY